MNKTDKTKVEKNLKELLKSGNEAALKRAKSRYLSVYKKNQRTLIRVNPKDESAKASSQFYRLMINRIDNYLKG